MSNNNLRFAIFIITHKRAENQLTLKSLRRSGYSGKIYFVVDDLDPQMQRYIDKFGRENVLIFNKASVRFDEMDNFDDRRSSSYGRNMCFSFANQLNLSHFLILDDDYTSFKFRYPEDGHLKSASIIHFDDVVSAFVDFLDESGALTVCFAQAGDFIGGLNAHSGGAYIKKLHRKAMNCFFCRTDRPFEFPGRINEDVNAYTTLGNKGELMFTVTDVAITQPITQSAQGGMTEVYKDSGTYVKSFYSVIGSPQAVRVENMGGNGSNTKHRIHHRVEKRFCYPMILDEKWKK